MYYIAKSEKTFEQACESLNAVARQRGLSVLHVQDLGDVMRRKGFNFPEGCRIFEACDVHQTMRVLSGDMRLNMALPCRLSVYTELGETFIGMMRPSGMMGFLSDDEELLEIVRAMEDQTVMMVNEAAH